MAIELASDLELPDSAVTQKFAFLARAGAGKTYSAGKLVEGLLLIGAPVIILDRVGNWYGLRITANGKNRCFEIPVFGGEYGDIPLDPSNGAALARILVQQSMSAVVDISGFTQDELSNAHFAADFCTTFFDEGKKKPQARMLVLEEAHLFAPQKSRGAEQERVLGAVELITRLGRNYGIGITLISQRPQSINKEVLNQAECLVVGQTNGQHERKAISGWVTGHGIDKHWTDELPELPPGTMFVWSPQWLKTMQKVKIAKKISYDSSKTPEFGAAAVEPKRLTAIDLDALKAALAPPPPATISQISKGARDASTTALEKRLAAAELANTEAQQEAAFERARSMAAWEGLQTARRELSALDATLQRLENELVFKENAPAPSAPRRGRPPKTITNKAPAPTAKTIVRAQPTREPSGAKIKAGAIRMLQTLSAFHPGTMTKAQVARAAKMTVTGGTFAQYWNRLVREGFLEGQSNGHFSITTAGLAELGTRRVELPDDPEARIDYWMERLKAGQRRMLSAITELDGDTISREELANAIGMTASGGTFSQYLGTLIRNRLVAQGTDGQLYVHPWLLGRE